MSRATSASAATASSGTSDESYENVVLVGGFSKAYSSLLAFIACPTALKQVLKTAAPPYLYSGPSPVASLATRSRDCASTTSAAMSCGRSSIA